MKIWLLPVVGFFIVSFPTVAQNREWFIKNNTQIKANIKQYDYYQYNSVINTYEIPINKNNISVLNSLWKVSTTINPVKNDVGAIDVDMTFVCNSGSISQAAISVDLEVDDWSRDNYVLMPAVAYNGNRFESRKIAYSPKLVDYRDIGKDVPTIVSDILRLDNKNGFSRIQDRSAAFSTPAIGFQSPINKRGWLMITDYGNDRGDYGLSIEENRDRSKATISITSPVMRERYLYMSCDACSPSWDKAQDFHAGDSVKISFRLMGFEALKIPQLFDKFFINRKIRHDGTLVNTQPYSYCQKIQEEKFNAQNFVPDFGYYAIGMRENFLQDWQIGWTGGMISTYPLLYMGNKDTRNNVLRNFDWLYPNGISPSGFYWDAGEKGNQWYGGDIRRPQSKDWHLIRKSGDAIYYILKQFDLMKLLDIPVKKSWTDGNRKVCDAFVKLWKENHQLGNFINSQNGKIEVGGSASGASAIGGLVLAASFYQDDTYLDIAKEIAEYMYQNFTSKGFTTGAPGDAMQNPDSESAYALTESYTLIYEATRESKWLAYAEDAAKQLSSWIVTDNYSFPKNSLFGKSNMKSRGVVYANTQNKHGAPGICTASGVALLRLYRATNNPLYKELLLDIAHNITQYMPSPLHPIGNLKTGWVCERVNLTDWEGLDRVGEVLGFSTWAETTLMLTTVEIPGLYIRTDKPEITAFDNVNAKILSNSTKFLKIEVENPTKVEASVTYLSEDEKKSKTALGENYLLKAPRINLKPNERRIITIKK